PRARCKDNYNCECGKVVREYYKRQHSFSRFHQDYLAKKKKEVEQKEIERKRQIVLDPNLTETEETVKEVTLVCNSCGFLSNNQTHFNSHYVTDKHKFSKYRL